MSIFKLRKPRQFNLKPRYYDEHKERLQQSEERVRKQLNMEVENQKKHSFEDSIRGKFRESLEDTRADKSSKMRLGIIIGIIIVGVYPLINYV
jgi:hypothetical protein